MPTSRAHVYVQGKVQGVFFRASARDKATFFGVRGWVKNCEDGSVEAVIEGESAAVEKMIAWCRKGPVGSFVKHVDVCWEEFLGEFDGFSIAY